MSTLFEKKKQQQPKKSRSKIGSTDVPVLNWDLKAAHICGAGASNHHVSLQRDLCVSGDSSTQFQGFVSEQERCYV